MPTEPRSRRNRRSLRAGASITVVAVVALLTGCIPPPPPPPPPAPDVTRCPSAAAGQVQVAVVVRGGPSSSPPVVCVVVPAGSDGLDALAARAARIRRTAPRLGFGDAFVCSVDGFPEGPDCGTSGPDGFSYWNYWTGGASWDAATTGAGKRIVTQGSVDAWVFGTWDFVTTFPEPPTDPSSFAELTR